MRRVSEGETALAPTGGLDVQTAVAPAPTLKPTKVLVTQTKMVTMVSTITGTITGTMSVPLPSGATATVVEGPECTGAMGVAASCAGEFEVGDLVQPAKDGGKGE